jgi:F-type H+-transporting ATPase subunit delta
MASAVANRYARALADVVSKPGPGLTPESVVAQIAGFLEAFRSAPELRNVLLSPAVAPQKKKNIISRLGAQLGLSQVAQNFLFVVIDHRRMNLLGEMLAAFEALIDERMGVVRTDITTAQPAGKEEQDGLARRLSQKTGRRVRARYGVDPALIGGAIVRIGSTIYDGSVRGQLRAFERRLGAE